MMVKYIKKRIRFSKRFPFIQLKKHTSPSFIIVKDLSKACTTEAEKLLYDQLQQLSYYVTPHYFVNGITINLALVPYKLALIETKANVDEERVVRQLKKRRWSVLFYEAEQLLDHNTQKQYLDQILQHAPLQRISNKVGY